MKLKERKHFQHPFQEYTPSALTCLDGALLGRFYLPSVAQDGIMYLPHGI